MTEHYMQYTVDDGSGEAFAIEQSLPYRILYRSAGTLPFFQLNQLGRNSTGQATKYSFTSPLQAITAGSFTATNKTGTYSGRHFTLTVPVDPSVTTPTMLPVVPRCEYLFLAHKTSPHTYIYVSSDVYNYSSNFRVWVGDGTTMKQLIIKPHGIQRWKDGGTTHINTEEGLLFAPSVLRDCTVAPRFADLPITPINAENYTIVDSVQAVAIASKINIGPHSLRSHSSKPLTPS
jgi:hypothetical protein